MSAIGTRLTSHSENPVIPLPGNHPQSWRRSAGLTPSGKLRNHDVLQKAGLVVERSDAFVKTPVPSSFSVPIVPLLFHWGKPDSMPNPLPNTRGKPKYATLKEEGVGGQETGYDFQFYYCSTLHV